MRPLLLAGMVALGMTSTAEAAVIYDLTSSGGTFTYQAPTFVAEDTTVLAADLVRSTGAVDSVSFLPSCPDAGGQASCDEVVIARSPSGFAERDFFYFPDQAFGSDGAYANRNILIGGTLTVSGSPDVAVPEPATLALLVLPMGAAGLIAARWKAT